MILIYFLISISMAWATFYLIKNPKVSPTRASALLSLLALLFLYGLNKVMTLDFNSLAALAFGASFVGMCSHKIVNDLEVIIGAVIFTVLFLYLVPRINSVGGALGFSAFISVMSSRFLLRLSKDMKANYD